LKESTLPGLGNEQAKLLGGEVLDIFLNEDAYWRDVPAAAWDLKIGGYQVAKKWLSYRESRLLGRSLATTEAREFTAVVRRLTALTLLTPELDANYEAACGAALKAERHERTMRRGAPAFRKLKRLPPGARRDLLRVLTSPSHVRADVIRQFHERGDEGMVEVLTELEADELLREAVILLLTRLTA
jgi:hypothetical protein